MRFNATYFILVLTLGTLAMAGVGHADVPATEVLLQGHFDYEGHYPRPGESRRYETTQRFLRNEAGTIRLESTAWAEGDTSREPEVFLVRGDRVFRRPSPARPWQELNGMHAGQARFHASAAFPKGRPPVVRFPFGHPRLGDVVDSVAYGYEGKDPIPASLRMRLHELHHQWDLVAERRSSRSGSFADSLFAVPEAFEPAPAHPDTVLYGEAVLKQVADGVWTVDMEDIDSRSMVVEFADHVAIIELALSSANGDRLVDAVKRQFPSKPVRYALFSHHHPHYLGGLRAPIAEGATVVTTPGNVDLVRRIADYPFRIAPDRLARDPRPVQVLPFPSRIELADSTNHLVALNIGERSDHTAEFVIFWLPRQRLLFEAEQGWVTVNGTLRASRRAASLLGILDQEKFDVERFVQSWPMRGDRPEVSRSELEKLIAKRR